MLRAVVFVVAAAISAASALAQEEAPAEETQTYPVAREYYPTRALENLRSGDVTLCCQANADMSVTCDVSEEAPRGLHFGTAAQAASRSVRLTPEGEADLRTSGQKLRLIFAFRPNPQGRTLTGRIIMREGGACAAVPAG